MESDHQVLAALLEDHGQRTTRRLRKCHLQGQHGAQDHADQQMHDDPGRVCAGQLQLAGMLAEPRHDGVTNLLGIARQVVDDERRQLCARTFNDRPHAFEQDGRVAALGSKVGDAAGNREAEEAHNGRRQQGNQYPMCLGAGQQALQPRGKSIDQGVDQQAGQQHRQQVQVQDQPQRSRHQCITYAAQT